MLTKNQDKNVNCQQNNLPRVFNLQSDVLLWNVHLLRKNVCNQDKQMIAEGGWGNKMPVIFR